VKIFLNNSKPKAASVLVGVLWCVVLLAVVVISVLHTARMDLTVAKNYGDRIQARYLALAGVEKAKALLYQNAKERSRSGRNHTGELYDAPDQFRDVTLGRGVFRVMRRARQDEGGGIAYGVSDEESRLNLNRADSAALAKLDGITPQIIAAINDWRDGDNRASPGGAEAEFYLSMQPPRLPRNAQFLTVRELLMVRGVSPDLLLGRDSQQNGLLDSAEDSPELSSRADNRASDVDTGWAGILTVDSRNDNVSASGTDRVNVQTADETSLAGVPGITPDIARAITAYRGQNQIRNIASLLDVTRPQGNQNQDPARGGGRGGQRQPSPNQGSGSGQKVISPSLLMEIADDVTADEGSSKPGLINVNTASLTVLTCLPGVDRELAQAIISHRQSSGFFQNIAWLLKVPGMNEDVFKQVAPLVTTRSETFRILCEGQVKSTGARQRIQAIVHVGLSSATTLSYREDDL
jgi:competence ComEA-like helix-hairpin-helix protein